MLFRFGSFWKTLFIVIGGWSLYGLVNFEFATVTLLSLILGLGYSHVTHRE